MADFRDLPLRIKGLLVVLTPVACLLVVLGALYLVQTSNQRAARWVAHTHDVQAGIQMLRGTVEKTEASALGYLVLGDPPLVVDSVREARERAAGILDGLERLVSDNSGQTARALRIRQLATRQLNDLAALPSAADRPRALRESRRTLDALRGELDAMDAEEQRLLNLRRSRTQLGWWQGYTVLALGLLFAPVSAVLGMLLFTNGIARRVQALDVNARRLPEGLLPVQADSGADEIGRLGSSLARAAAVLERRDADLRRASAELERRVAERTAELAGANQSLQSEISERTHAEEQLAELNQRLQAVIDASPLAILRMDLDGRVKSWNRAAERIFGWAAEEVLDRRLPTVPGEDGRSFQDLLAEAASGESVSAVDMRRRRKDGRFLDTRLWTAPLRSSAGELRGTIGIIADFTEQRRLEEQFRQAQKMEAIGRLAGGVAHDFNNLLTIISGYGEMLLAAVKDDEVARDAAEEVLKAAGRAGELAGQLLTFSRRQVIQPKIIDLNVLIGNVQRLLARVIGEDIELRTLLAPGGANVKADAGQMEQVLMNLAVNARDAMPAGGNLTIETTEAQLDEHYARLHTGVTPGPYIMLAVSDTGTGMDADTRSHLFEPFFTTKERGKGTGLGLSTVYGIVKQHGGDIWVYSEPGHGSTFKVYLPAVESAAVANGPVPPPPARSLGNETVLLVEDEAGVRKLIRDILVAHGYKVLEAESGEGALSVVGGFGDRIDLLLTDIVMPKMSGWDLAEAMALLRPDTKVLFLSGYTNQVVVEHGVLEANAEFLQKPFTPETLARKIRTVLDRRRGTSP
jgi:PAS domain S-box-containing protein